MEHLTYFDQQQHYKVMMVNNTYVDLTHEQVGGAGSAGDFGSMLRVTLARQTNARDRMKTGATLTCGYGTPVTRRP